MTRRTLAREISAEGITLHAGTPVRMTLAPADTGVGIVFRRSDLGGREIPARYDKVNETRLGTVIEQDGVKVGVVEHLMAAVAGAEIDDLVVTLNGPEPPILDGDALSYLRLIEKAGVTEAAAPREAIKVLRIVRVEQNDGWAALLPSAEREFEFRIEFSSAAIGQQGYRWTFTRDGFAHQIAPARTFGFVQELDALNKAGLGRGASLENTLAIDGDRILNQELVRFTDEFVRHKILDAIGDMGLAGAPILARFEGFRSGHALNNQLLRALFADPGNYERVQLM